MKWFSSKSYYIIVGIFLNPKFLEIHQKYLYRGKKKNGFFIEAGAYDGEMYSNSLYFELKHQVIIKKNMIK